MYCMAAAMEGGKTALEIVIGKHLADDKDIKHYCKKWREKTCGIWKWPETGTFEEQWCQKMRDRIAIWGEQKRGQKAREKQIKQEKIAEWFYREGKDRRERERALKEQEEAEEREKEEKREREITRRIQEAVEREKVSVEKEKDGIKKEREESVRESAPPWGKQRELGPPPPYNPQFWPPIKPRRNVPPAGVYVLQEREKEEKVWEEAEMELQGTFKGYQRKPAQYQEEPVMSEEEEERGKNTDGKTCGRGGNPHLSMPDVGSQHRQVMVEQYLEGQVKQYQEEQESKSERFLQNQKTRITKAGTSYEGRPTSTPRPRAWVSDGESEEQRQESSSCSDGEESGKSRGQRQKYINDRWKRVVENRWNKGKGRKVRMEGEVMITPYLGPDEQELEDRVARLEDVAIYDKGKMEKMKHLAEQSVQIVNSVKELKEQQTEELQKLQIMERSLNQSTAQQIEKLQETTRILASVNESSTKGKHVDPHQNLIDLDEGVKEEEEPEEEEGREESSEDEQNQTNTHKERGNGARR